MNYYDEYSEYDEYLKYEDNIKPKINKSKGKTKDVFFFQEEKKTVTLSSTLSVNIRD